MSHHTPHQKGIIKRFYEHRDTLALQKLGEIVSNLYLETSEPKRKRAWKSALTQMKNAGLTEKYAQQIHDERDLDALAKIVTELSGG